MSNTTYCENVQVIFPKLAADDSGLNSANLGKPTDMGRCFIIKSFRWLRPEEV
ncbi:MAG: hypothetical protein WCO57_06520 [Verrucomicrobiota bacterium]